MAAKPKLTSKAKAKKLLRDKKFRGYCMQTAAAWSKGKLSASDIIYLHKKFTGEDQ